MAMPEYSEDELPFGMLSDLIQLVCGVGPRSACAWQAIVPWGGGHWAVDK